MTDKIENEALDLLLQNEEALAGLYENYSRLFPQNEGFWADLAKEEVEHGNQIRLFNLEQKGAFQLNPDRINLGHVRISLKYIAEKASQARHQKISESEALEIALGLETSMIEKKYFEALEGDQAELRNLIQFLAKATKVHTDKIRAAYAKVHKS